MCKFENKKKYFFVYNFSIQFEFQTNSKTNKYCRQQTRSSVNTNYFQIIISLLILNHGKYALSNLIIIIIHTKRKLSLSCFVERNILQCFIF